MGQIRPLVRGEDVESLWEAHCRFTRVIAENPVLATNRAFMQAAARAERAFKDAFNEQEARRNQ